MPPIETRKSISTEPPSPGVEQLRTHRQEEARRKQRETLRTIIHSQTTTLETQERELAALRTQLETSHKEKQKLTQALQEQEQEATEKETVIHTLRKAANESEQERDLLEILVNDSMSKKNVAELLKEEQERAKEKQTVAIEEHAAFQRQIFQETANEIMAKHAAEIAELQKRLQEEQEARIAAEQQHPKTPSTPRKRKRGREDDDTPEITRQPHVLVEETPERPEPEKKQTTSTPRPVLIVPETPMPKRVCRQLRFTTKPKRVPSESQAATLTLFEKQKAHIVEQISQLITATESNNRTINIIRTLSEETLAYTQTTSDTSRLLDNNETALEYIEQLRKNLYPANREALETEYEILKQKIDRFSGIISENTETNTQPTEQEKEELRALKKYFDKIIKKLEQKQQNLIQTLTTTQEQIQTASSLGTIQTILSQSENTVKTRLQITPNKQRNSIQAIQHLQRLVQQLIDRNIDTEDVDYSDEVDSSMDVDEEEIDYSDEVDRDMEVDEEDIDYPDEVDEEEIDYLNEVDYEDERDDDGLSRDRRDPDFTVTNAGAQQAQGQQAQGQQALLL